MDWNYWTINCSKFCIFILNFKFDFITSNLVIFLGILSNLYLIFIYKKTQLSDRSAFIFLVIDILQLGVFFICQEE